MTLDLTAIRQRCEAATPGPYRRDCSGAIRAMENGVDIQIGEAFGNDDARFWKYARTDIPLLLDEVEDLRRRLTKSDTMRHDQIIEVERLRALVGELRAALLAVAGHSQAPFTSTEAIAEQVSQALAHSEQGEKK